MQFGLFGAARAERGPDIDSGSGFREFVDQNVEAEALGYRSTFVVEHHFTGFGQISATLNLLTEGGPVNQGKQTGGARQAVGVIPHGLTDQIVLRAIVVDHGERNGQRPIDSMAVHIPQ